MEEMMHAVIQGRIEDEVSDYRSNAQGIGTDHQSGYDSGRPFKCGLSGKTGAETQQDFIDKFKHMVFPICRNLCYRYGKITFQPVCWFWIEQLNITHICLECYFFLRTFNCPVNYIFGFERKVY